jgi:AbrB family looped-hinge helix DNA binding protein
VKEMINANLKILRNRSKLTQEEVADRIGVSRQAVAKWENGSTVPDINNCLALAELFKVSLDDLVNESDSQNGIGLQPKGKHVFGLVTVGEQGQIILPKKAREIFHIDTGDSLVVLGDESQGIALVKQDRLMNFFDAIRKAEEAMEE